MIILLRGAAIGIYGMLAYPVGRRTHEIGLRMALGARGGDIVRLVLGQGVPVIVAGIALGVAGAQASSKGRFAGDDSALSSTLRAFTFTPPYSAYVPTHALG